MAHDAGEDAQQQHITAREFDKFTEAITTQLLEGFGGVNRRLDKVNGNIERHDRELGHLLERTAKTSVLVDEHKRKLDKMDTGYRHARRDDPDPPTGDNEPITMKDLKRAAWVFGTAIALTVGAAVVVITMILQQVGQR